MKSQDEMIAEVIAHLESVISTPMKELEKLFVKSAILHYDILVKENN